MTAACAVTALTFTSGVLSVFVTYLSVLPICGTDKLHEFVDLVSGFVNAG